MKNHKERLWETRVLQTVELIHLFGTGNFFKSTQKYEFFKKVTYLEENMVISFF
jgi:hypothetical protein